MVIPQKILDDSLWLNDHLLSERLRKELLVDCVFFCFFSLFSVIFSTSSDELQAIR